MEDFFIMDTPVTVKISDRDQKIVRTSFIGILANVFLAAFKAAVGITVHSVAIVMDAVNNLSDAASSVITIIGTKLAGKKADKKHPFGYGRMEYLSAMSISVLVLYAGVTAFVESVKKIIHPDVPDYNAAAIILVIAGVGVKILLGRYVKSVGESVHSDSLVNSGEDATMDALVSASTLAAAVIYLLFHLSLEAWLGAVIGVVIIKSGAEMLMDTFSRILGERADPRLVRDIKNTITSYPEISGAYDLIIQNYGPDAFNASVHIEVPDTFSAEQVDRLSRKITWNVYRKHHVILTAIGIYSVNTTDPDTAEAKKQIREILDSNPYVIQIHGFHFDKAEKKIRFDVVISFDADDREKVYREICEEVQKKYPDYTLRIVMDTDFSEETD